MPQPASLSCVINLNTLAELLAEKRACQPFPEGEILSTVPHGHTTCTLLQTEGSSVLPDTFMDRAHAQRFSDFKPLN